MEDAWRQWLPVVVEELSGSASLIPLLLHPVKPVLGQQVEREELSSWGLGFALEACSVVIVVSVLGWMQQRERSRRIAVRRRKR